jgi:GNAT superfamily N-acetyltransferase
VNLHVIPLADHHLAEACALFRAAYDRERSASPLLPFEPLGNGDRVQTLFASAGRGPGVAAFSSDRMVGYLSTTARFPWKGQRAAICREHAHAAVGTDRARVYELMYTALAEEWVASGSHLHILCCFAHDAELHDVVFRLGFGALIAENLRDLSPVAGVPAADVVEEPDPASVRHLDGEHARYYRGSPIFLSKQEEDLPHGAGDALFVHRDRGESQGYFVVGPCTGEGEGLLLGGTNTAQVKSAFLRPELRGRGIGGALLGRCVEWARERGYDRLFVEHETANITGAAFWRRHFTPYLHACMRYVDDTL